MQYPMSSNQGFRSRIACLYVEDSIARDPAAKNVAKT